MNTTATTAPAIGKGVQGFEAGLVMMFVSIVLIVVITAMFCAGVSDRRHPPEPVVVGITEPDPVPPAYENPPPAYEAVC